MARCARLLAAAAAAGGAAGAQTGGTCCKGAAPARAPPESVGLSSERLGRVTARLDELVAEGKLPFARMMVMRRGKLAYDHTADSELSKGKMGDDAFWRFYSMTKIWTSVGLLKLMEMYDVTIDEPVSRWVPAFANATVLSADGNVSAPARGPVTLRHLLTHSSGMSYAVLGLVFGQTLTAADTQMVPMYQTSPQWDETWGSLEKYAGSLAGVPLNFHPGERWAYAVGHVIVGRVIEAESGMSLRDFMQKEVFDPMCVTATWARATADALPMYEYERGPLQSQSAEGGALRSACGCAPPDCLGLCLFTDAEWLVKKGEALWPDGQLSGTAADAAALARLIGGKGRVGDAQILSPASMAMFHMNMMPGGLTMRPDPSYPVGLEVSADGSGYLGHSLGGVVTLPNAVEATGNVALSPGRMTWGGIAGTLIAVYPKEDVQVVFLTQTLNSYITVLRRDIGIHNDGLLYRLVLSSIVE